MTKDELVRSLVNFAAQVRDDHAMTHGDVDHVARLLAEQRHVLAMATQKRAKDGPAEMRPLSGARGMIGMHSVASRALYESLEESAREVETWPAWKRAWL